MCHYFPCCIYLFNGHWVGWSLHVHCTLYNSTPHPLAWVQCVQCASKGKLRWMVLSINYLLYWPTVERDEFKFLFIIFVYAYPSQIWIHEELSKRGSYLDFLWQAAGVHRGIAHSNCLFGGLVRHVSFPLLHWSLHWGGEVPFLEINQYPPPTIWGLKAYRSGTADQNASKGKHPRRVFAILTNC